MAREIKFRGKDATGRKGWVYGDLVHNQRVTETGTEPRVMVGGYEVVPESVGQFTGLKDANYTDIYEGDFISVFLNGKKRQFGRVEWHPNGYFFINDRITDAANDSFCTLGEMLKKYRFEVGLTSDRPKEKVVFASVYDGGIPCQSFCAAEGNEYLEEKIRVFAEDCQETGVPWSSDLDYIARHFFELGFNAKKED